MEIREVRAGRNALSNLFKGVGAEVGVERGKFSEVILETCDKLYCVDLWKNYEGYREHVSDAEYEEIYQDAQRRLRGKNVVFIQGASTEVARISFPYVFLDFLYVDAAHDYDSVLADLKAWYPNVKSGGVVAGHDWVKKSGFGVIQAVTDFCKSIGVEEITIWKGDKSPSWSFIKK